MLRHKFYRIPLAAGGATDRLEYFRDVHSLLLAVLRRSMDKTLNSNVMIALQDIRSLTDFQRNTKAHLRRLKSSGRPAVLTVNGRAELIVQDAAAFEDMLDAIRGIQRGLDEMKAGTGKPFRQALDEIRAKYKIPRREK